MAAKNFVPSVPQSEQLLSISTPGPYNPVAMVVPLKVAKRVLNLEFVEMAEITSEELHDGGAGKAGAVARPPVTGISLWLKRFSVYAAIQAKRIPDKAPELLMYQATIVRAERNYEGSSMIVNIGERPWLGGT